MSIETHTNELIRFRDKRDWKQFHDHKNLAISLMLEAAEVLELFQWTAEGQLPDEKHAALAGELADVYAYLLLLAHEAGIDLARAFEHKMKENDTKYPVDKSRGRSTKYSQL